MPVNLHKMAFQRMSGSGTAMLNRLFDDFLAEMSLIAAPIQKIIKDVICKRLGKQLSKPPNVPDFWRAAADRPGLGSGRVVLLRGVLASLRSPSRLLVSVLLGIVGVAVAASIASFAGGQHDAAGVETNSATPSQPLAASSASRSGWLTLAIDTALPESYFNQLLSLVVGLDTIEADGARKTVYLLDQPRNADVQIRLAAERSGRKVCCSRASWLRSRPLPQLRMTFPWQR